MFKKVISTTAMCAVLFTSSVAFSAIRSGSAAPDFTGTDTHGVAHSLSQYRGKTVVLEWTNHDCPYVVRQYSTGNMQSMQKDAVKDGVVWLSIVSSAEGKQGYTTPEEANAIVRQKKIHASARILDPKGTIGRLYGAATTPEFFIIDEEGKVIYSGAIDSIVSSRHSDVGKGVNYVRQALAEKKAGKPISVASTLAYGCSIKYAPKKLPWHQ